MDDDCGNETTAKPVQAIKEDDTDQVQRLTAVRRPSYLTTSPSSEQELIQTDIAAIHPSLSTIPINDDLSNCANIGSLCKLETANCLGPGVKHY